MNKIILLLLTLSVFNPKSAQKKPDYGSLKNADEVVIYSFGLKNNQKTAVLCRQKNNKYLVYRFGTKDKVELQYPATLDARSWKLFKYEGYSRGGGKANDAEEIHSISFTNNGVSYKVYDGWNANHGPDAGILVQSGNKKTDIAGNAQSKTGSIGLLRSYENLIPNSLEDE